MSETVNLEKALVDRGVNPALAAWFPACLNADVIERTVASFDSRRRQGRDIGPGVLVDELRRGGAPAAKTSPIEAEEVYGEQIVAWLREHFPQWNHEGGNRTHTAAIACVIRLHHKHGKSGLSIREHGAEIREAVRRFDRELGAVDGSAGEGGR